MFRWILSRPKYQFLLGLSFLILGLFIKLTYELHDEKEINLLDKSILNFILSIRSHALSAHAIDITALGSFSVLTIFTLFAVISFLAMNDHLAALQLTMTTVGSGFLSRLLKNLIGRERPSEIPLLVEAEGFSYPSGHSLAAAAFFIALTYLMTRHIESYRRRLIVYLFCLFVIVLVSLSRIYLGVHYPSDTVSGVMFGISWALLVASFFSLFEKRPLQDSSL